MKLDILQDNDHTEKCGFVLHRERCQKKTNKLISERCFNKLKFPTRTGIVIKNRSLCPNHLNYIDQFVED